LEESCIENHQGELQDWVVADDGVFAEGLRPEEIGFTEDAAEEASHYSEEYENEIVPREVVDAVVSFLQVFGVSIARSKYFEFVMSK
jgi:hypothetical protein